jgi:hypothetical protein
VNVEVCIMMHIIVSSLLITVISVELVTVISVELVTLVISVELVTVIRVELVTAHMRMCVKNQKTEVLYCLVGFSCTYAYLCAHERPCMRKHKL